MELTVLGKYSPFQPAHGAGVGYWLGGPDILLECGPGVVSRFQEHVGPLSMIHTVILSHLHFDHFSDFLVLRQAAAAHKRYTQLPTDGIEVWAPPLPKTEFGLLGYKEATSAHAITEDATIVAGGCTVKFHPGVHGIPSFAVRVEGPSGVFAYSGDTRPCEGLLEAARGADLFLCEASGMEEDADYVAPGHLTAKGTGEVAKEAGVKRLLITHIFPFYDEKALLGEAQAVFPGALLAEEGRTYRVGG